MTGLAREAAALTKLSLLHVWGDPLKYRDLEAKVSVEQFNTAIVLCDGAWVDPDQVGVYFRFRLRLGAHRVLRKVADQSSMSAVACATGACLVGARLQSAAVPLNS